MNDMTSITPVTITEKLNWLEHRYWKFGEEENFDDHLSTFLRWMMTASGRQSRGLIRLTVKPRA